MAGPAYPSGFNTFVPSFDATGNLIIGYSRNPKDFPLNRYIQIVPVKRSVGYYLKLTAANAARVLSGIVGDFVWQDGNDAPSGEWNTESFSFLPYITTRYAFPFRLGWKAIQQADWKVVAQNAANCAQQAMTGRTLNAATLITTAGNWNPSHVATATTQGGGFVTAGTATNPIIKKIFNLSLQQIQKDTLGVVRPKDAVCVISPVVADAMGRSQEVHSFLQQSPWALAQVRGDSPSQNGMWGLPDALYGVPVVVEDTVRVTSRKGASTLATGYLFDTNSLVFLSRPGALVSEGTSSFSTLTAFMLEEMTTETKDDPDNRRTMGRVVEDYQVVLTSDISGFLVTHAIS